MLAETGATRAEPSAPKNQASVADTVILPPSEAIVEDMPPSTRPVLAREATASPHLRHLALIAARVDPDGCMQAPLTPGADDRATASLETLRAALVRAGVEVTLLPAAAVERVDAAQQRHVQAIKGAFKLSYGQAPGRWFATRAEMAACARVDPNEDAHRRAPHAELAAMLAALHVDAVLGVDDLTTEAKGPRWNIIEGALSSSGQDLDPATSSASLSATLALKDGSVPWRGDATADGALRPAVAEAAQAKLKAFFTTQLTMMAVYQKAHPDADDPPPGVDEAAFNAVVGGELQVAPAGSTLGPSMAATLQAAAGRLADQLRPWLAQPPGSH
ncbi:hypothetical protein [Caulobacter sp. S45]|uniref:hypothetical protein n=1 Tax=Caulobacter sp. S45 TaxID=1641861 RepID=UPI0015765258|nr:hypothetical protein [Caulobacter sp. S45]